MSIYKDGLRPKRPNWFLVSHLYNPKDVPPSKDLLQKYTTSGLCYSLGYVVIRQTECFSLYDACQ